MQNVHLHDFIVPRFKIIYKSIDGFSQDVDQKYTLLQWSARDSLNHFC